MESGGGGAVESRRKEKGERMKVTSPSLPTPTTSLLFPAHFTWPVGSRSVHTSKKGGRAKKKRASEKGREESGFGPTFLLTFSLLSYSLEKANLFYTYV